MEIAIGSLFGAGEEPVENWSENKIGSYNALSDINKGKCPEYLVQTYYGGWFEGYNVYLSDNQKVAVGMAFEDFCIEKKKYMVEVADLYRNYRLNEKVYNLISDDVYRSILNWSFSITD